MLARVGRFWGCGGIVLWCDVDLPVGQDAQFREAFELSIV